MLCGVIAVVSASVGNLQIAAFFVLLGIFFDFFDGFAARQLNVSSELGTQLDSLADMVTSGVVPGIVMYQLLNRAVHQNSFSETLLDQKNALSIDFSSFQLEQFIPLIGFMLPLAAAYRLANFNLDERQSNSFIGLPTPAMALFVISLPLIILYGNYEFAKSLLQNTYVLIVSTVFLAYLMNAELSLFSLKFKNFSISKNWLEVLFLVITIICILVFKFIAIPLIIILYLLFSILKNTLNTKI